MDTRIKNCEQCGESFSPRPNEPPAKWKKRRFCSEGCARIHHKAAIAAGMISTRHRLAEEIPPLKAAFLDAYAKNGKLHKSCEAAGCSYTDVYRWRAKDPEFATKFKEALDAFSESLISEAIRRGQDGVDEDVYYRGRVVGSKKVYSDQLLLRLLAAYRPEFRTSINQEITGKDGAPLHPANIQVTFVRPDSATTVDITPTIEAPETAKLAEGTGIPTEEEHV